MFRLTNINNIPFKFVSDLKIILLVNGMQTASATYPCPYCFITLEDLKSEQVFSIKPVKTTTTSEILCSENCLKLKTYGDLKTSFNKFCSLGSDKKVSKFCHSTINNPLFLEPDDYFVIQKCPIPELHVLQGFVNHLFWNGLVCILGRERALLWPKKTKISIPELSW